MKLISVATFIVFAPFILIWFTSELLHSLRTPPNKRLPR